MPNPWDVGSAKLLAAMGFQALATTSGGFAATLGRLDGSVTRDEALAQRRGGRGRRLPVSADFENCFADDPAGVAATIELGIAAGLAGCSVEDYGRRRPSTTSAWPPNGWRPRPRPPTAGRSTSCSRPGPRTTSTAAPTWPTPSPACSATRRRAPTSSSPPGRRSDDIRGRHRVDRPVNVLALPACPPVAELAALGVAASPSAGFASPRSARCRSRHRAARPGHVRLPRTSQDRGQRLPLHVRGRVAPHPGIGAGSRSLRPRRRLGRRRRG